MNTPGAGLLALTFALAALAPCSGASAASNPLVEGAGLRGPLVNAGFSTTDPTGCVETDVYVSANSGTEHRHQGGGLDPQTTEDEDRGEDKQNIAADMGDEGR